MAEGLLRRYFSELYREKSKSEYEIGDAVSPAFTENKRVKNPLYPVRFCVP